MATAIDVASFAAAPNALGSAFVLTAIALALIGCGVVAWTERRSVIIDAARVESRRMTCLGTSTWSEPLATYRGVLRREILVRGRREASVVHEVRLVHDSDARSVTLFATRDAAEAQAYQARACHVLGMSELRVGADGFVATAASATVPAPAPDEPVRTSAAPPLRLDRIPGELRVEPRGDGVAVTIDRCEMAWMSLPLIVGFPLALLWFSGATSLPGLMRFVLCGFAVVLAVVLAGIFVLDRIGRRRIEVDGDRVEYFVQTPFGNLLRNRIDLGDLLGATVRRDGNGRPELAIEAKEHNVEIGGGLPLETLEWLRALLIENARRAAQPVRSAGAVLPVAACSGA